MRFDVKNLLYILGYGVDGVSRKDENNLVFFGVGKNWGGRVYFDWSERIVLGKGRKCSGKVGRIEFKFIGF